MQYKLKKQAGRLKSCRLKNNRFIQGGEKLAALVTGVIAPARCMGCLKENTWLCVKCRRNIMKSSLSCVVCGKEGTRGITCFDCREKTVLKGLVSVGPYGLASLRRGIHWLKFKGVSTVAEPLAKLLIPRLTSIAPLTQLQKEAALIPVPLHKRRMRQRGFNQSLKIAQAIGRYTNIPVMDVLVRQKSTWTQTKLPPELREGNMSDAFVLKEINEFKNRSVLIIVDDVTTTGATLSAAASPLKKLGVKEIWGAVIAQG